MLERDFQKWVIDAARTLGWSVWHVPAPMQWDSSGRGKGFVGARDAAGLADLILIRDRWLIFAEIKGTGGKLSVKQIEFLGAVMQLDNPHVLACAWKPGLESEVEAILARPETASAPARS